MAWQPGTEADTLGDAVLVVPLADSSVSYTLLGRVVLGDLDVSWSDGPHISIDGGTMTLPVALPAAAYVSTAQDAALADLVVTVQASVGGRVIDELPARYARVAWPDGPGAAPLILDQAVAATDAPEGVLGRAPSVPAQDGTISTGNCPADEVSP
ncbi:MAG: hypothetical protein R3F59_17620 [Myxococcota bacterium]